MTLWLLAVMPILFPQAHQFADHLRTRKRLAGARRALNRQNTWLQISTETNRGRYGRLPFSMKWLAIDPRLLSIQEIARG